jgi:hypothetical protein
MNVPRLALFRKPLDLFKRLPSSHSRLVLVSEWWVFLKDAIVLHYVGLENKRAVREDAFTLRGAGGACSEYFVTIANDACVAHRPRYLNARDICSLRLHREFASQTGRPASTRFCVADAELTDYKAADTLKTKPRASARREDNKS